ncbi:MAG: helix-turn-helix domain-containing protein [Aureliella sp.]
MEAVTKQMKSKCGKAAERWLILNAFVDFTACELKRSELLVWLTIFRDSKDGIASSSQRDIARRTGLARKTVERSIASLSECGLLLVVYPGGYRRGTAKYRTRPVTKEKLDELRSA